MRSSFQCERPPNDNEERPLVTPTTRLLRTYTIGQLCREFRATPRALRFYEDLGLLFPARRGTQRIYSHQDRARLKLTLQGKAVGLPLREVREILDLYDKDDGAPQAAAALRSFRRR